MRVTILPHARDQMNERGILEEQVRRTLEEPDQEYPSDYQRIVAERSFSSRRSALKVVYNQGLADERIVVTVMYGRPRR